MGHDIIFLDHQQTYVGESMSTKWLRDYAPREITFDCEYYLKDKLTTNDIANYSIFLQNFIEDMTLDYPVFPAEDILALKFDSPEKTERFQAILARVIAMTEEKAGYASLEKDLENLSQIIQEEEEEHPSWADETTVKFWEFSESLERGLYMKSEKHQVWIEVELYEVIQKFIETLENAVRNGWMAEWSY